LYSSFPRHFHLSAIFPFFEIAILNILSIHHDWIVPLQPNLFKISHITSSAALLDSSIAMDLFNFENAASDNVELSGTNQTGTSNEQLDFAPLDASQQAEYEGLLQNFDYDEFLNADLSAEELQNLSLYDNSIVSDPLPADQIPNDLANEGLQNFPPMDNNSAPDPSFYADMISDQSLFSDAAASNQFLQTVASQFVQSELQQDYSNNFGGQMPEEGSYPESLALEPQERSGFQSLPLHKDQNPNYVYRNDILNSFQAPEAALRVIDHFIYPFSATLERALEKEASRQEDPESESEDESEPSKPLKGSKNKRSANILKQISDAKKLYKTIPQKPAAWGSINPDTGKHIFQYSAEGELTPGANYTVSQISEYLAQHRLHDRFGTKGENGTHRLGLKLWIQHAPGDSTKRYPKPTISDKCRFADCPIQSHAITKGQIRVCFDEQTDPDFPANPFHNAGYIHLFCLEKFLDFPDICKKFNVLPDTRKLLEGDNKAAITKDHASQKKIVKKFVQNSKPWSEFDKSGLRPVEFYEHTLSYLIVTEHMDKQPRGAQWLREKRAGNSVDVHKGNLDLWATNQLTMKKNKAEKEAAEKAAKPKRKRSEPVKDEEDEEDVLDEHILEPKLRPFKRARRS
jgi:hypothetical protein